MKVFLLIGILCYFAFPSKLFENPYSTILTDEKGKLLSAKIALDGQWRFPSIDSVPPKLATSIHYFEDEFFHWHLGVNPVSIVRAFFKNLESGKVKSGGSTISMQVIRLSRKNKRRTYLEKIIEIYLAVRMEFSFSKKEILNMYVSHAPYGGNVVGVEAASWRYFKRSINELSWAEYCMLAVLPNAPSLVNLAKNRHLLKVKRDWLLNKLYKNSVIDSVTYSLSIMESIPAKTHPLPRNAYHLLDYAIKNGKEGQRIKTSIDNSLQIKLSKKLDAYVSRLSEEEIRNACAIVVSVKDGSIKAYVGNSRAKASGAKFVDLIQAKRSSGSILKPFLYGQAIADGMIHTSTYMRDVPISIDKFSPSNFDKTYTGVVPAGEALARSLNVPAAVLLRDYGISPFIEDLQQLGFETVNKSAENYGLTLILGGAEVKLWDLATAYAHQAQQLNYASDTSCSWSGLKLWEEERFLAPQKTIDVGAWWLTTEALTELVRPGLENHWKQFSSSRKIAWKTGTSFGFRDAWAIGYDAEHVVAVWVGNAEGEGRPGLTGASKAAPLMFQAFQLLPKSKWFQNPVLHLKYTSLCKVSGMSPSQNCPLAEVEIPMESRMPAVCTYHSIIHINSYGNRVFRDCEKGAIRDTVWFNLDPIAGYYFKQTHPSYDPIPALSEKCRNITQNTLAILYPKNGTEIIIPTDLDKEVEQVVFEAMHINEEGILFWHLDDSYIGRTKAKHLLSIPINKGKHKVLVMDELGNSSSSKFLIH